MAQDSYGARREQKVKRGETALKAQTPVTGRRFRSPSKSTADNRPKDPAIEPRLFGVDGPKRQRSEVVQRITRPETTPSSKVVSEQLLLLPAEDTSNDIPDWIK